MTHPQEEALVEKVARALVSFVFQEAQPDRGDVFGWIDDRAEAMARAAIAALFTGEDTAEDWECFCDAAYFHMWCVRRVGERTFGQGFHLVNKAEAEALRDFLSSRQATPVRSIEGGEAESLASSLIALSHDCENTDGWEAAASDLRNAAVLLRSFAAIQRTTPESGKEEA